MPIVSNNVSPNTNANPNTNTNNTDASANTRPSTRRTRCAPGSWEVTLYHTIV